MKMKNKIKMPGFLITNENPSKLKFIAKKKFSSYGNANKIQPSFISREPICIICDLLPRGLLGGLCSRCNENRYPF